MGRKLTWRDVFNSLPDREKKHYNQIIEDINIECDCGRIEEAKELTSYIENWQKERLEVARKNRYASQSNLELRR